MAKYVVRIEPNRDGYFYSDDEWKQGVDGDDFDEDVVILGNRDHDGIEEASWWGDTIGLLEHFVDGYTPSEITSGYNLHKMEAAYKVYEDYDEDHEDIDCRLEIARILYPRLSLQCAEIRGYSQGDRADVIYVEDSIDINELEDWYFGNVYDVYLHEINEEELAEYVEEYANFDVAVEKYLDDYPDEYGDHTTAAYSTLPDSNDIKGWAEFFGVPADSIETVLEVY